MGGYGSGRPGWRTKAEHCRSLDVNRLKRAGCLKPGYFGGWQWSRDGEQVASIGLRGERGNLRLVYRHRPLGEDWEEVDYRVPLATVPCNLGGERTFFLCPGNRNGRSCWKRVAKLYSAGRYYLCRHCYQIAYASQSEDRTDRLRRTADRKRMALGGDIGMGAMLPPRPKGMWRRTYERKLAGIIEADERADQAFWGYVERRWGIANYKREIGLQD